VAYLRAIRGLGGAVQLRDLGPIAKLRLQSELYSLTTPGGGSPASLACMGRRRLRPALPQLRHQQRGCLAACGSARHRPTVRGRLGKHGGALLPAGVIEEMNGCMNGCMFPSPVAGGPCQCAVRRRLTSATCCALAVRWQAGPTTRPPRCATWRLRCWTPSFPWGGAAGGWCGSCSACSTQQVSRPA
jgi:hypothetical protein